MSQPGFHHLFLPGVLLHVLAIAIVAFFILFAASKSDGFVRFLGNLLGWILLLGTTAMLAVAIYGAVTGQRPPWLDRFHERWMQPGSEIQDHNEVGAPPQQPSQPPH